MTGVGNKKEVGVSRNRAVRVKGAGVRKGFLKQRLCTCSKRFKRAERDAMQKGAKGRVIGKLYKKVNITVSEVFSFLKRFIFHFYGFLFGNLVMYIEKSGSMWYNHQ